MRKKSDKEYAKVVRKIFFFFTLEKDSVRASFIQQNAFQNA